MDIEVTRNDGILTFQVKGSITSSNASSFSDAIEKETVEEGIIIDAKELEYISSAGLRVILSAKKKCGKKLFQVINVSSDVKNVFDITGFSEIMDIQKAPRHIDISGCEKIGAGACGECYRLDDETIIKLYYPKISKAEIEQEKALAKKAFVLGVPTAISYDIVEAEGRTGVVYELIKSKTLKEIIRDNPDNLDHYIDLYVECCKAIHECEAEPDSLPDFKEDNRRDIANVRHIEESEREILYKFLDAVPDSNHCTHGDLNINNIMVENGKCVLIDMGEFSHGLPLFDLSRLYYSQNFAGADDPNGYNDFYKLPQPFVTDIYNRFFFKYFGVTSIDQIKNAYPDGKWFEPLAWFRACTSMLKFDRWPKNKQELALKLLREKLVPFCKKEGII